MTAPRNEDTSCIFCVAASDEDQERTLTLKVADGVVILLNRYPYTNGHVMIAPTEHVGQLFDSSDETLHSIIRWTAEAQRILSDVYEADGFNVGMNLGRAAGAGVADHCHMHVVPRWEGDSNFMSVTGRTRLVPEDLESTWNKLRPRFQTVQ